MPLLTSLSVDEILLLKHVTCSINFGGLPLSGNGSFLFKTHELLFAFVERPMLPAGCSKLCSRHLAWAGVFMRSTRLSV